VEDCGDSRFFSFLDTTKKSCAGHGESLKPARMIHGKICGVIIRNKLAESRKLIVKSSEKDFAACKVFLSLAIEASKLLGNAEIAQLGIVARRFAAPGARPQQTRREYGGQQRIYGIV